MSNAFPDHWGMRFTPTIHSKPEGPTDPSNTTLPANFTVCITGAGKGLGYHIGLAYARAGAKGLCISSRTQADLDKLAAEIKVVAPRADVLVQTCDTQDEGQVEALAGAVWARWGRCDVVVANAGVISKYVTREGQEGEFLPVGVVEDGDLERVVGTNLLGTWRYVPPFPPPFPPPTLLSRIVDGRPSVAKHFIPHLAATRDGGPRAFVAITSIAAHMRDSAVTPFAYNLSKMGMNRLVEHIAVDHGAQGIQAFAVHPGAVLTPQTERHHETQMGGRWTDCEFFSFHRDSFAWNWCWFDGWNVGC